MKQYILNRSQVIHASIEECWEFFSKPKNLKRITPPAMGFHILSQTIDGPIYSGMQIDYKVSPLLNIPLKWKTEIQNVDPPYQFIDTQIIGPYKKWVHTHKFEKIGANTLMIDEVNYELPWRWIGVIAHNVLIKTKLKSIFDYRSKAVQEIFNQKPTTLLV